ncbi:MAG: UbiA family prenyltransferase [Candidatus Thorarchaeota archaeon]
MNIPFKEKVKAYLDLTRAHFAIVWPLLFCSGLMLAFRNYGGFSWSLIIRVFFIGLFGFEAGMVLNDILDRNVDQIEPDPTMTNYWRPFKQRPIPSGLISIKEALILFGIFILITIGLIATLPYPNFLYVYGVMIYAYSVESFYNIIKRNQNFPFAQLVGRTDLAVFPIAGYLCFGQFDTYILLFIVFLYPWALAHLATNDIIDFENDKVKDLKTIAVLYGNKGNLIWIYMTSLLHFVMTGIFLFYGGFSYIALGGFAFSLILILSANIVVSTQKTNQRKLLSLPMFHASLLVYIIAIILDTVLLPSTALISFL